MNLHEIKKSKKQTIMDFVDDRFQSQRTRMREVYRSWMLNLAWARGFQNLDFNTSTQSFSNPPKDPWRVRLVNNLMLPLIRKQVAKITHIQPVWDVIPATPDEEDVQISQTATKVLQHYWQVMNMSLELIRLTFWQATIGNAFLKIGWDFEEGEDVNIPSKGVADDLIAQVMEQQGLLEVPEFFETKSGTLFADTVPAFNITFDETAGLFEKSHWCIESQLKSKDWVVEKYGTKFKDLLETTESEIFVYPFVQGSSTSSTAFNQPNKPTSGVLVHELFIKKNKRFKNGLHATIAGNEFVQPPEDNPFEHGELPYAHFLEIFDPSSPWGTCVAEQIRPNQALYNRVKSGIVENINLMSNLQWMNPRQSGVKSFTNRPGGVIHFNAPFEPKQSQHRPLPAYVERILDRTRLDIQDTASSHDVSEAKAEPGIRSGKAVLALQDADDSVLGPVLLWHDTQLSRTGRLAIQTVAQNTERDQIIQIRGEFNELETITFSGSRLSGESKGADYWKVRVKTFGRQALSRSGRESLVRTLLELGLMNPQADKDLLIRVLGAGDILTQFDIAAADRTRQWREITQQMVKGQEVEVTLGQNHQVHIDTIKKYISSSQWDKLETESKQMIVTHLDRHIQEQAREAVLPQVYAQMFLQGVQGGQGQPGAGQPGGAGQGQQGARQPGGAGQ